MGGNNGAFQACNRNQPIHEETLSSLPQSFTPNKVHDSKIMEKLYTSFLFSFSLQKKPKKYLQNKIINYYYYCLGLVTEEHWHGSHPIPENLNACLTGKLGSQVYLTNTILPQNPTTVQSANKDEKRCAHPASSA